MQEDDVKKVDGVEGEEVVTTDEVVATKVEGAVEGEVAAEEVTETADEAAA
ncbi:MAG: hypothetical protein KBB86_01490 [Candidatus Pacebacteria bacterium]|nr:hypothetical protein [Candidatus Paceibacterota bacterium]